MLNFTIGPVMTGEEIRKVGMEQVPYFRTAEFSEVVLECEALLKQFKSVEALKEASVEEIAKTPGVPMNVAQGVYDMLHGGTAGGSSE